MFVALGFGIPFYFFMSVNRGTYQGHQNFNMLSMTYQTEMWSRLLITLAFLLFSPWEPALSVAMGIGFFLSFWTDPF